MIAVDWGTSRLRAYLLDKNGQILAQESGNVGVMTIRQGGFSEVLEEMVGPWLAQGAGPVFMSGMVGSRQGWAEAPYVQCPASLDDIAAGVASVHWGNDRSAFIVPGLACIDNNGVPDFLRGEETQALGALHDLPSGELSLYLPGTHSKHLHVRDGNIESFVTHMTGEIYSVMRSHSILGRIMDGIDTDMDTPAFDAGLRRARDSGGLSHHLFGVRARALAGELSSTETASYLSGILIGHEVSTTDTKRQIFIVGAEKLSELYLRAFEFAGANAELVEPDIAALGLYRVARAFAETQS
ncbi:MAG: 2-dehydro-3-deoxygalactonokinase [Pusillimonas sp.]